MWDRRVSLSSREGEAASLCCCCVMESLHTFLCNIEIRKLEAMLGLAAQSGVVVRAMTRKFQSEIERLGWRLAINWTAFRCAGVRFASQAQLDWRRSSQTPSGPGNVTARDSCWWRWIYAGSSFKTCCQFSANQRAFSNFNKTQPLQNGRSPPAVGSAS